MTSSGAASASAPPSLGGTPSTTSLATTSATNAATATATGAQTTTSAGNSSSSSSSSNSHALHASASAGTSIYSNASTSAAVLQDTDENRQEAVLLQKLLDISRHRHHTLTAQILGDLSAYNNNMEQDLTYIIKQYIQTKLSLEKSQAEVKRLQQANAELVSSKQIAPSESQVGLGITSHQPTNLMHSSGTLQQQLLHMGQLHFQALQEQQSRAEKAAGQLLDQQARLDAAASQIQEQQSKLDTAGCELQMTTQELIRALEDVELLKSKAATLEAQLEALETLRGQLESSNHNKLVVNSQLAGLLEAKMRELDIVRMERDQARRAMDAVVRELMDTKQKFQYFHRMLAPYLMSSVGHRQGQGHASAHTQALTVFSNASLPPGTASPAMPKPGTVPENGPRPSVPPIAFSPTNVSVGHAPPIVLSSETATSGPMVPVVSCAPVIPATAMQISTAPFAGTPLAAIPAPPTLLHSAPSVPPSNVEHITSLTFIGTGNEPNEPRDFKELQATKAPKTPKTLKAPKSQAAGSRATKASPAVWKESSILPPTTLKNPLETPAGNVTRVSFGEQASAPTSSPKGLSTSAHRQPLAVIDLTANGAEATASSTQAASSSPSPLPSSSTTTPASQLQLQPQSQPQAQTQPPSQPQTQLQTQLPTQPEPQSQPQLQPAKESMGSAHVSHLLQEQQLRRLMKQQEIHRLQLTIKEIAERTKVSHRVQQERSNEREEQEHLRQTHETWVQSHSPSIEQLKQIHESRIVAHSKVDNGSKTPLPVAAPATPVAPKAAPGSDGPLTVQPAAQSAGPQGEKRQLEVDSGDEFENRRMQGGDGVTSPKRAAATPLPPAAVQTTSAASPKPAKSLSGSAKKSSHNKPSANKPSYSKASSITVASFKPVTERIKTAKFPAFEAAPSPSPPPLPERLLDFGSRTKKQKRRAAVRIVDESGGEDEEKEGGEEEDAEVGSPQQQESSPRLRLASHKRFKPKPGSWYVTAVEIPVLRKRTDLNTRAPRPSDTGEVEVEGGVTGETRAVAAEKGTGDRRGSTTSITSSIRAEGTPAPSRSRSLTAESSKSSGAGLSSSLVMRAANTTLSPSGSLSQASRDVRAWVHDLNDDEGEDSTETEEEQILEQGFSKPMASPGQAVSSFSTLDESRAQATSSSSDLAAPKSQVVLPRTSSFLIKLSEAAAAKRNVKTGSLATIDLGSDSGGHGGGEDVMDIDS
ncbi:unnamed protein product [Mortierella alpina]